MLITKINELHLFFDITPKAKQRPRFSGHAYTPKKTLDCENAIKQMAMAQLLRYRSQIALPLTEELSIEITNTIKRPKKPKYSYPRRGEIDKFAKSNLDALNSVVYKDDMQVKSLSAVKKEGDENSIDVKVKIVESME